MLELQECETVTTHHPSPFCTTSTKQLLFYSKQHDQGPGSKNPYITTWGSVSNSKMESLPRFQDRAISIIDIARIKDVWNKFQQRSHYSNYNTRFCENLQIPKYNLEYSKKRFSYTALKAWNEIPMNIRELPTLYQYKKTVKKSFDELEPMQTRPPGRSAVVFFFCFKK